MAFTAYQFFITSLMVVSGSWNTLNIKWMNSLQSTGSDGETRKFQHPFVQTLIMFLGEFVCYIVFKIMFITLKRRNDDSQNKNHITRGNQEFSPFILLVPVMCDLVATICGYIGLNFTFASSFQMLRGSTFVFVGLFSILAFGRIMKLLLWTGIFFIALGLTIVGFADYLAEGGNISEYDTKDIVIGDALVVMSAILRALEIVVEEKYLRELDAPPVLIVGLEGLLGFVILLLLHIPFYFINVPKPMGDNPRGVMEDIFDALVQTGNNILLVISLIIMLLLSTLFNFAGMSTIKELSGTTTMVLDTIRTAAVWGLGLIFLGEKFNWLQMFGFLTLFFGMCLYNQITLDSCVGCCKKTNAEETTG